MMVRGYVEDIIVLDIIVLDMFILKYLRFCFNRRVLDDIDLGVVEFFIVVNWKQYKRNIFLELGFFEGLCCG